MSRAKRSNKRRVLGAGVAGAALITGVVAAGAAIAGEESAPTCSPVDPQSSKAATMAMEGAVVDLGELDEQLSDLAALAGADPQSVQGVDDALRSIPSNEAGVLVEGLTLGDDQAPRLTLKSMDQKSPEAWAQANPDVDLEPMNAQIAAVNGSLGGLLGNQSGLSLDNLQAAFGQIAINSIINVDDIELELKQAGENKMEVRATSLTSCA